MEHRFGIEQIRTIWKKQDKTHLETEFSSQHLLRTIQFALLLFTSCSHLAVPCARGR